ncbi:MAG TPA: class I SAM-dependent methyltransferase, partial [Planctomycetota bacterium]|nr:class I SAM-dependent methyltransferase [Planctomycetota bacterium]
MQRTLEPEVMDSLEEATLYDAMDNSGPNRAFVERLVTLGASGRVLDIGTGPGHIPLLLVERLPDVTVVGIDLSEHMLRVAERRRVQSPHRSRIEFRIADAKTLPFPRGSFDVVASNTILHHISDPRQFLSEAWRVLKPGGTFLIRDLFRPPTAERASELVRTHAANASPGEQELLLASLHAALEPEELRACAREAGLTEVSLTIDSDRHMSLE